MAETRVLGIWLMVLLLLTARQPSAVDAGESKPRQVQTSSEFPEGFVFGTSSAAYQVYIPFHSRRGHTKLGKTDWQTISVGSLDLICLQQE